MQTVRPIYNYHISHTTAYNLIYACGTTGICTAGDDASCVTCASRNHNRLPGSAAAGARSTSKDRSCSCNLVLEANLKSRGGGDLTDEQPDPQSQQAVFVRTRGERGEEGGSAIFWLHLWSFQICFFGGANSYLSFNDLFFGWAH